MVLREVSSMRSPPAMSAFLVTFSLLVFLCGCQSQKAGYSEKVPGEPVLSREESHEIALLLNNIEVGAKELSEIEHRYQDKNMKFPSESALQLSPDEYGRIKRGESLAAIRDLLVQRAMNMRQQTLDFKDREIIKDPIK